MAVVVSDTSPIRALHHIGHVGLLSKLFGEVFIPPAVVKELRSPASGLPSIRVEDLSSIRVIAPTDLARVAQLRLTLDSGESEALSLAIELHAAAVLIDEEDGRAAARRLGLPVIGVIGILIRSKHKGLIGNVAPLLERLRREIKFFISDELMREVLVLAGESAI